VTGEALAREIAALSSDRVRLDAMGAAARRLARPDAARVIADRVLELARR
jgi:UDP-N-acetylglucosamine:LPS N-acetylglucosamine transferase